MDDFNKDVTALCRKYGGFAGVLSRLAECEKERALDDHQNGVTQLAIFHAKVAYLLLSVKDYWDNGYPEKEKE